MRPCSFTAHLRWYQGDSHLLSQHLARCDVCRTAAALLSALDALPHTKTVDCPDAALLGAFSEGVLLEPESTAIRRHVAGCGYCIRALRPTSVESDDKQTLVLEASRELVRADRAIAAYRLAKDLATWLSTDKFPRELAAVRDSFDSLYDAAQDDHAAHPPDARVPAEALAFSMGKGGTVARRIMATAALIGRAYGDSACSRDVLLNRLLAYMTAAPLGAPPDPLFSEIASWLASRL